MLLLVMLERSVGIEGGDDPCQLDRLEQRGRGRGKGGERGTTFAPVSNGRYHAATTRVSADPIPYIPQATPIPHLHRGASCRQMSTQLEVTACPSGNSDGDR